MSDTVTEAAVYAAAKVLFEIEWLDGGRLWEQADDGEKPYWRESARAALEAALPLVVEGERERCAEIAEELNLDGIDTPCGAASCIAAAIRADKGGEWCLSGPSGL